MGLLAWWGLHKLGRERLQQYTCPHDGVVIIPYPSGPRQKCLRCGLEWRSKPEKGPK